MLTFKARRRRDPTASPFLTPSQRRVMNQLRDAMNAVRDQVIADEGKLLDAIMHRPLDQVVDMIPIDPWIDIQESIAAELEGDLIAGGHRYAQQVPAMRKATVNFRFDEPAANASRWARTRSGTLITNVTTSQRNTVRTFVSGSLNAGDPPRTVARNLRNVVGLTPQQAGWVQNFEDRLVSRYVGEGMTLQAAQARAAGPTARYHSRIHRYRTETIARTEILTASHEGRRQAWDQGLRQGFISPNARQEWSAEVDDRACAICEELDRTTVRIGEMFPDGDPPIHPMCRCDVLLIDEPANLGDVPTDVSDADLVGLVDEFNATTSFYDGYILRSPLNPAGDIAEYGEDAARAAQAYRARMAAAEPETTRTVIDLANKHGARPDGLDFRLKAEDSLTRKIASKMDDAATAGDELTATQAAEQMRDVIRYTYVIDETDYARSGQAILDDLVSQGYTVDAKNYWVDGNAYRGVNIAMRNPDDIPIELQLHTPRSLQVKEGRLHEIYELQRVETDPIKIAAYDAEMVEIAREIPMPAGVSGLGRLIEPIAKAIRAMVRRWRGGTLGVVGSGPPNERRVR